MEQDTKSRSEKPMSGDSVHKLKNHLTVIKGNLDLIDMQSIKPGAGKFLAEAREEIVRLNTWLDEISE